MEQISYSDDALDYIAKIADGGMRDAITLLDKCLAYSNNLTIESVIDAIGTVDFMEMLTLTDYILKGDYAHTIEQIESIHMRGKELKQFIKQYKNFILDVNKYFILNSFDSLDIPKTGEIESWLRGFSREDVSRVLSLLTELIKLDFNIKWEVAPKPVIESSLIIFIRKGETS